MKFDREMLVHISTKLFNYKGEDIIEKFNDTLKKYSKEDQKEYFKLIKDIDKDYSNIRNIRYSGYLFEIAETPYTDFETIKELHEAVLDMCDHDYEALYNNFVENNKEVIETVNYYMTKHNIFEINELRNFINNDLKKYGLDSQCRYLIKAIENKNYKEYNYVKINDNKNGFDELYYDLGEIFAEAYDKKEIWINEAIFKNIKKQELKLKM